jgi:nucleoside-diphosphate-sugar epimerase
MIDALIVARDQARDLPFCLTTLLGWTNRIFVIDAGSSDATGEVARRYGAHVVRRDYANANEHRQWALENLPWQSPWVLLVEPEEVVTPALRDALKQIAAGTSNRRYEVRRGHHARHLVHTLTESDGRRKTRFFPRSCGFPPGDPDDALREPILFCLGREIGAPPRPRPPGAIREAPPGTFAERFGSLARPGQRVVVTGGSGFIGSTLVEFYHQAGAQVVNLDYGPPRSDRYSDLWRELNLLDRDRLAQQVGDLEPELFFHLAARTDLDEKQDPAGYAANITGVDNLLAAVEGLSSLQRLIVTSTQLVAPLGYRPIHDQDYRPDTVYGQSKVATEVLTRLWDKAPCPWTLVRPTSIWGPGFEEPYRRFFLALARGRYVHPGRADPRRSFGFAGNVVYEYVKLSQAPEESVAGKTFYLTDYEPVRVRQWAEVITREMGITPPRQIPLAALRLAARAGDVAAKFGWKSPPLTSFRLRNMLTNSVSDTANLQEVVGPLPYTLEEGVRMTVKWLRDVGLIDVPGRRQAVQI